MKRYLGALALYFAGGIIFTQKELWLIGIGLFLGFLGWVLIWSE